MKNWGDYLDDNGVLVNKLGITDGEKLRDVEGAYTSYRSMTAPEGEISPEHLKAIHKHLFGRIYEWAGAYRTVNIQKGGTIFCYQQYIKTQLKNLCESINRETLTQDVSVKNLSHF